MDDEQVPAVERDRDDLKLTATLAGRDVEQLPVDHDRRDPGGLHRETGAHPADAVLASRLGPLDHLLIMSHTTCRIGSLCLTQRGGCVPRPTPQPPPSNSP